MNKLKILLCVILLGCLCHHAYAARFEVSKSGAIKSIVHALDLASNGDTILIKKGTYTEGNILIEKEVVIIGIDNPVIDGEGTYEIFSIVADHVVVRNITFQNVGATHLKDNAAIRLIRTSGCIIDQNTLLDTYFGIYLEYADSCVVSNNKIEAHAVRETTSGNAIHLWNSKFITIENNKVSGHRDGLYLEFAEQSQIRGNISKGNLRYGLHFMFSNDNTYTQNQFVDNGAGVAVMYSKRIEMLENIFKENEGAAAYGILLKDITDSRIERNDFEQNTIAILAEGSNRLKVVQNNFKRNGWAVKVMGSCENLEFTENNFIGNTFEMGTSSKNIAGHVLEGNYWASYNGYDLDKDGRGDIPHRPVRLFSYLVEQVPTSIVLINSLFIDLLELAERVTPSLTPAKLADKSPSMNINIW